LEVLRAIARRNARTKIVFCTRSGMYVMSAETVNILFIAILKVGACEQLVPEYHRAAAIFAK
jgi:hypothetical protein